MGWRAGRTRLTKEAEVDNSAIVSSRRRRDGGTSVSCKKENSAMISEKNLERAYEEGRRTTDVEEERRGTAHAKEEERAGENESLRRLWLVYHDKILVEDPELQSDERRSVLRHSWNERRSAPFAAPSPGASPALPQPEGCQSRAQSCTIQVLAS